MGMDLNMVKQLQESMSFLVQASKIGSLVSGIVMFQVVLLTLMGANNSGREIAAERLVFEKEKLSGLRPLSYVASKAAFLAALVVAQSLWMGLFVHYVCGFPGELGDQLLFLSLANAAMTSVCLAISSMMGSAEQASLVSIYLVGFQLPLSGAVLALPRMGRYPRPSLHRSILELVWRAPNAERRAILRHRANRHPNSAFPGGAVPLGPRITRRPGSLRGLARLPAQPAAVIFFKRKALTTPARCISFANHSIRRHVRCRTFHRIHKVSILNQPDAGIGAEKAT